MSRPDGASRRFWFGLFCVACAASVGVYLVLRPSGPVIAPQGPPAHATRAAALASIRSVPHVYVRSTRDGEFGRVVVATLDRPNDDRFVADVTCDRVAFGREAGVCLVDNRASLQPPGLLHLLDLDFRVVRTTSLPGVPSRARVAADGRHAATTVFVTGENYSSPFFSTRTHVYDLPDGAPLPDLEQFTATQDGRVMRAVDVNVWGVTFLSDSNTFLATLATGGRTHLVEGDVRARTLRVVRADVECPSLSPDGTRVVFKRRRAHGVGWRLFVLDRHANREWPLAAETRSIDDQVEWLDQERVLYGYVEERGLPDVAVNVWMSDTREGDGAAPRLFIRGASSPTVVR